MGKKSKSVSRTIYGNTTTDNPYVTSSTTNKGTVSSFKKGTAFDTINDYINNNMNQLLDDYLNPNLDSVTNRARLDSFMNALNGNSVKSLENDIINPLSKRNMVRSSQATNMYNNLAANNASQISNYANELLSNSSKEMANLISNLMLWYLNGYSVLNDTQRQSLSTSQGNATRINNTSTGSGTDFSQMLQMAQLAAQLAAAGL